MPPVPDLGPLSKRTCVSCCLFRVCEPLRDFRKVYNMNQDRPFVWKSHWKCLGWTHKLGGSGTQGITRVGQTSISHVNGRLWYGVPLPAPWREDSVQEQWLLPALLSGWKLPLYPLPQKQTVQFLLVCFWCFSSCHFSAGAQSQWDWVSLCTVPLGETPGSPGALHFSSIIPTDFHSQKFWNPGLGGLVWVGLRLLAQGEPTDF